MVFCFIIVQCLTIAFHACCKVQTLATTSVFRAIFIYLSSLFAGSVGEFDLGRPAVNLFEPSTTTESRSSMGLFGTSMSPVVSGCSIFGDVDSTSRSKSPEAFTFSFGTTSQSGITKSPNRPAFSLF